MAIGCGSVAHGMQTVHPRATGSWRLYPERVRSETPGDGCLTPKCVLKNKPHAGLFLQSWVWFMTPRIGEMLLSIGPSLWPRRVTWLIALAFHSTGGAMHQPAGSSFTLDLMESPAKCTLCVIVQNKARALLFC